MQIDAGLSLEWATLERKAGGGLIINGSVKERNTKRMLAPCSV